eukprot:CAMPEP_0177244446 /NCGR_PEP_ID=MMETSP0367-20130122/49907_1 /TAXON_ID=447022 ORGANISM="Scrippsiella hangoei-like, Strain SHHI-4" /NCGR_SAMPLE_ID=MMETSP0367 /ASSEMBLY_ACC=CAM_ASM_000362 /LENGTH=127 /DNA_ID=CAMNT_0018696253 /DNA_START=107 /DNA_END=490 /DNA_ORIENTATION=-
MNSDLRRGASWHNADREPTLGSAAVELEVVLDLLSARGVQGADQDLCLLACTVVHGVHPEQRHSREADASKVPIVPLHTILVHHVPAPREAALRERRQLDLLAPRQARELEGAALRHGAGEERAPLQ